MEIKGMRKIRTLLSEKDIDHTILMASKKLVQNEKRPFVLVGILTRGVPLANRLQQKIKQMFDIEVPVGKLDITFYRDDLTKISHLPVVKGSHINFDIEDRTVILVDDVLYTGRTVRAAIDELLDFGRPKAIRLFVLVDRGLRELPICPDYTGLKIETSDNQVVLVKVKEVDGIDEVVLMERNNK